MAETSFHNSLESTLTMSTREDSGPWQSLSNGNVTQLLNGSTNSSSLGYPDCDFQESPEENVLFPFIFYGILLNLVGAFGLVGNIISVMILTRPNMRSSINCCFVGLATFDSILLVSSMLMFGVTALSEHIECLRWYQSTLYPWVTLVAYPLGVMAQTGSVYLTVTVTVERYVAVCHPLKARSLCTYGRAKMYVVGVALFAILYNITRFAEITYVVCDEGGSLHTIITMTSLRQSAAYVQVYITWLYLFVMYLIPFLSLLVFNSFIYNQVRLANDERQHLSRRQQKELTLAVMLLVVVVVFFFCNVLAFIVSVLEIWDKDITELTILNNFLVTVNSSVNFVIYCIFGQKFRKLFLQRFCFGRYKYDWSRDGTTAQYNSYYGGHRNSSVNEGHRLSMASTQHSFRNGSSRKFLQMDSLQLRRNTCSSVQEESEENLTHSGEGSCKEAVNAGSDSEQGYSAKLLQNTA